MSRSRRVPVARRPARGRLSGLWKLLGMCVLVAVVLLGPAAAPSLAKTLSKPIDPPSDPSTVVFTLSLAGRSYSYSWADVSGAGRLGSKVTHQYTLENEEWSGVWLRTVLADVEQRSGITLDENWKLRVTAVDAYACALFVGDVKDPANNYLLATDPVQGCKTGDPTAPGAEFYEPTYVRICTNGDYGNSAFPARLVATADSATVLDAAGNQIPATAHQPIGIIVAGDAVNAPASMQTYSGDAFWITADELSQLKDSRGTEGPYSGLWATLRYSYCENHGAPVYGFAVGSGVALRQMLLAAGLDDGQIAALDRVTVTSGSDGYSVTFDPRQPRYVFLTPAAVSGDSVDPLLALYVDEAATLDDLPAEATTPVAAFTKFLYGQLEPSESTKCSFVSGANSVSLPTASPAFTVDAPDAYSDDPTVRQKSHFTLAALVTKGNDRRTYQVGGATAVGHGLDLKALLDEARGRICPQDKLFVVTSGGTVDPGLNVAAITTGAYLLAYYSEDANGAKVANGTQTMIYGDGVAIADVLAVKIEHVDATAKLVLTSPTVSQSRAIVARGSKLALRAVATKAAGALAPNPIVWRTSNARVATVATNGTVTARRCGTATITATSGSRRVSFTVKVVARAVNATRITLPRTKLLARGSTVKLSARVYPAGATNTITWKSSNSRVVKVDRSGRITGVRRGRATITVRTSNGKTATCIVTVR